MRFLLIVICFFFYSFSMNAQSSAADTKTVAAFDNYIQQALPLWKTPGISVAVVKDGKLLFKKAYGLRELGKPEPYTTSTLSTCASTSKAMTAVGMGMLVDQGKVKWTDKVVDILPGFKLADPYVTAEITVLDLFTHNTGLGNGDNLWVYDFSRNEIIKRMQYMQPAYSLRSSYIYQNLMYIVAGEVIHTISGKTWDSFITDSIFKQLGMTNTFADHSQLNAGSNSTSSHFKDVDTIKAIPYIYADNIGAAGGVWSCADDMSKWLLCLLDSTKFNGGRLLKPETYATMFKPHALAPTSMYTTMEIIKPHWFTYGLGWFQHDYNGKMVQMHTGSLAGLTAIAGLIPDDHFGIYIFGNLDHAELRHALMFKAFDLWCFNKSNTDWSTEFYKLYKGKEEETKAKEKEKIAKRVLNTKPSLALNAYTGLFKNKQLGTVEVILKDNVLQVLQPNNFNLMLEHWQFDLFRGQSNRWWFGKTFVQFIINNEGKIDALLLGEDQYEK